MIYLRELDAGTDNACWVVCAKGDPGAVQFSATEDRHRFGAAPEPVVNPSADWCDRYADWYYQGER